MITEGEKDDVVANVKFRFLCAASATLVAIGIGCDRTGPDYEKLELVPVSGTITFQGEPLPKALVVFESQDQTFSWAVTDESGRYELMFNSEAAGTTQGEKTVRIWTSRGIPSEDGQASEEDPDAVSAEAERIPAQYNRESTLKVFVDESSTEFDFRL
ncbi:hypothetical protein JCM19992_22040 [Thermostilla marina]